MHLRLMLVALLLPASALGQTRLLVQPPSIRVEIAPPAPIVEAPPPAPSPQHVWTAGYWEFRDGHHVWVPGRYVVAPQPTARWVPARWIAANGGWYFQPGHWSTVAQPAPPTAYPPPQPQPYPPPQGQPYPPPQGQPYPPPQPPAYGPPQPPAHVPPRPVPAVLDAREIHADVVRARVIYAHEVRAADGRVGTVVKLHGKPPKMKGGAEISQREVVADTINAKNIEARWIEADEIHAKQVRIGRH